MKVGPLLICMMCLNACEKESADACGSCPSGSLCVDNRCARLCNSSSECNVATQLCIEGYCNSVANRLCSKDEDCANDSACDVDSCKAGECFHENLPNGTLCDDGAECTNNDACDAGVCVGFSEPHARTECVDNATYWVDSCGEPNDLQYTCANGCDNGACTCPAGMIRIGILQNCIDAYEGSIYANQDCTGTQYGVESDDYPSGFPDLVSSRNHQGTFTLHGEQFTSEEPTQTVYACSKPGVLPSGYLTYFQAQRACQNSGKYLCGEYYSNLACEGQSGGAIGRSYPYGANYVANACNDIDYVPASGKVLEPTGAMSQCEGGFPGLSDLIGNVAEWLTCSSAEPCAQTSGPDVGASTTCLQQYSDRHPADQSATNGLRCCSSL